MNNLKDIFTKGHGFVVKTGNSVKDFYNETKELVSLDSQFEEAIYNLGLAVYEEYKDNPRKFDQNIFGTYFMEITKLNERRNFLQEAWDKRFAQPVCQVCGEKLNKNAKFCSNCGELISDVEDDEDDELEYYKIKTICSICGHKYEEGDNFCGNCGNKRI